MLKSKVDRRITKCGMASSLNDDSRDTKISKISFLELRRSAFSWQNGLLRQAYKCSLADAAWKLAKYTDVTSHIDKWSMHYSIDGNLFYSVCHGQRISHLVPYVRGM